MFTPYFLSLNSEESAKVARALKMGLRAIKETGADWEIEVMKEIVDMYKNKPMQGGYSTQEERNAAYMRSTIAHCEQYGCD